MADSTPPPTANGTQVPAVGGPPPVPGYDTGTMGSSGVTPNASGFSIGGTPMTVGSYTLDLVSGVKPTDRVQIGMQPGNTAAGPQYDTVQNVMQRFVNSLGTSTTDFQKFRLQAYQAGLLTSKNASKAEVVVAYQTVVEEAVKQKMSPDELIQKAVTAGGWNNINATVQPSDNGLAGTGNANSAPDPSNTQTIYTSYLDPATIQGSLADAYYRLMGRNPTPEEYQAFMQQVYNYQDEQNTEKDTSTQKTASPGSGGAPGSGTDTTTNSISERQIGQRGLEFLAGQTAMANPEEGTYQAATTYYHAMLQALSGPGAGLQASGPTTTAP